MQILTPYLFVAAFFVSRSFAQDRRPTISFITQPEIVTDIGGTVEMKCSVQYARDFPVVSYELKIYQGIMFVIYKNSVNINIIFEIPPLFILQTRKSSKKTERV